MGGVLCAVPRVVPEPVVNSFPLSLSFEVDWVKRDKGVLGGR